MATTYTLIDKTILTGTQSSVEFLSIDQTYTDLKLVCSVRGDRSSYADDFKLTINNNTSATYSNRRLSGQGSGSTSSDGGSSTGNGNSYSGKLTGNTATANVFGSSEFYFPNYSVSGIAKSWSAEGVSENNASNSELSLTANLVSDTNPITRIKLESYNSPTLITDSSFYLYGIKNS
jgi:hypothetical protein